MMLNIAWITSRRNPCFEWFADSIHRETGGSYDDIRVIAVDFYAQAHLEWKAEDVETRKACFRDWCQCVSDFLHVPPKPCVWQGPHRLTSKDYFAASNTRNTALCHAKDGYIVYVDDLSVLMPGWLGAVREAANSGYIACGAFRKVLNLVVEDGLAKSFDSPPYGQDSRWASGVDNTAVNCPGSYLFGCSVGGPVNAFLQINGWPQSCDSSGVGAEDCFTGNALELTGHTMKYDRRMLTLESEERHHSEKPLMRMDKGKIGTADSKSHAAVRMFNGCKRFDNDFPPFPDIAALRQHILSGGEFPVPKIPQHDWFDGEELSRM